MNWQDVQREGICDPAEMEKAVCREGFCLAQNPINIFRGEPNLMIFLIINITSIILIKFSS